MNMSRLNPISRLFLLGGCGALLSLQVFADAPDKQWVTQGDNGHLHYDTTSRGDTIPDFSHAGYGGGGVALPDVPVQQTLAPVDGDNTPAIQKAIDTVAALPLTNGLRGTVLLKAGTYSCETPIVISQSGVVLRGSGSGDNGTVIQMTGAPHVCIQILGAPLKYPHFDPSAGIPITDAYIPTGAQSFTVNNASSLKAGDTIYIERKLTAAWIHSLGMDTLVRNNSPQTWIHTDQITTYERTIRSVDGNKITLDVPLPDAIDAQLLAPDTAMVYKDSAPARLSQCGIESLQINSSPPTGMLTTKNNNSISLDNCEDCWVKDITMKDTLGNILALDHSRRITLENANAFHTATVAKGAGYPADYTLRGTQILLDRSSSTGHGSFYVTTANTQSYLNVVLNCNFYGDHGDGGAIQPHARWSTAMLVDGCNVPDGKIEFINRGTAGSGHGWAMGWGVAWNCTAKILNFQQPPGVINWCIGCKGDLDKKTGLTDGFFSYGTPVVPKNLYLAQLQERLGASALKNMGY
jgi:hypothetical protein